jgi:hypothetical protein
MPDRLPRIKWPHTYPICTLFGIVCALLLTVATAYLQYRFMHPLQRYYLGSFVKTSMLPMKQDLRLIEVYSPVNHGSYVMAVDPWIATRTEAHKTAFYLSDEAVRLGLSRPRFYEARDINPKTIRPFFTASIYHGTLPATFRLTIVVFSIALGMGIILGAWFDQKHQEEARRGVQIRGPKMLTPKKAQRYLKGDGIALFLEPKSR